MDELKHASPWTSLIPIDISFTFMSWKRERESWLSIPLVYGVIHEHPITCHQITMLWLEEILHHLGWLKPYKYWHKPHQLVQDFFHPPYFYIFPIEKSTFLCPFWAPQSRHWKIQPRSGKSCRPWRWNVMVVPLTRWEIWDTGMFGAAMGMRCNGISHVDYIIL